MATQSEFDDAFGNPMFIKEYWYDVVMNTCIKIDSWLEQSYKYENIFCLTNKLFHVKKASK